MRISDWSSDVCSSDLSRPGERAGPPAVDMGFKRLNHHEFNEQHDADEGQGIAEDGSHVEQLEIEMNLKADAVGAAEQFHHQYDLPDQRQAGAAGSGDKGKELRQHDVAQQLEAREAKCLRHLHEVGIKGARALAQDRKSTRLNSSH